jgi:hypothetical protein
MSTLDIRSHAFNVGIAKDHSPSIALFIAHLAHWAEKNLSNNTNIHDGLVWSYDTLDALCEQFPYFTRRQIETIIKNCVEAGLVVKGNYNQTQYDRTCWYALTPVAYNYFPHLSTEKYITRLFLSISHNGEMDLAEWGNRFTHFVMTIPDTDPDTDPTTTTTEDPTKPKEPPPTKEPEKSSGFNTFENDCLKLRVESDTRTPEEFIQNVNHHIENNSDKTKPQMMRQKMLLSLLKQIKANGVIFESVGLASNKDKNETKKKQQEQKEKLLWSQYQQYIKSPIEIDLRERGIAKLETFEVWKTKNA